ncbi:MAG TPA: BamA/TamA family outer membrane protein [Gammaproteobacteria bacterium]
MAVRVAHNPSPAAAGGRRVRRALCTALAAAAPLLAPSSFAQARAAAGDTAARPEAAESAETERARAAERAMLERRGARIGAVKVTIDNVFDTTNPAEDKPLYRWANRVHIKTRESVIREVLLFEPGDPFEGRVLDESARLLREKGYLAEATVEHGEYDEATNTVEVEVWVRDAWSLAPDIKLGRSGGENEWGIGLSDGNLLGTGRDLTVSYSSDVDRDETFAAYGNPNVFGSRVQLDVELGNASDGHRRNFTAERPFYSLDTRWSLGGSVRDELRVDTIYDRGEEIDEFQHDIEMVSLYGGWSRGFDVDRTRRWLVGFTYEEDRFAPTLDVPQPLLLPEDRKLVYPWIGWQLVVDDYREMTELNDMGRTEDIPLGLSLRLSLGYADEHFGADREAWLFRAEAHKGWEPGGPGRLLLFDAAASARSERGELRNSVVSASARYYHRNLGRHLFTASLSALAGNRLDADNQVLLGGDNGLRGYPLRYQTGEHRAVLTLEQRFFTDWYPARLFRVGYAVFLDVGRVWGEDPRAVPSLGTLYDVGVGLRLSSPRSSGRSVVHIDLAFPLNGADDIDSVQLLLETKRSF